MKNRILTGTIAALALPLLLVTSAFAQAPMPVVKVDTAPLQRTPENSYAAVVERVGKSVVTISVNAAMQVGARGQRGNPLLEDPLFRRFFGLPEDEPAAPKEDGKAPRKRLQPAGLGSGVIVSADGYILTNNHVIERADEIIVTLADGKTELKARKIGADEGSDIAVLKVEAKDLIPATFADSDQIKVGDVALAIGNPFALRQSVTMGIISATGRNETGISAFGNFIQTDASINPGNSGGALIDTAGRLIGINTAIFSRTGGNMGIGFAVPSNQARTVMESLIKFGKVQRGFLGIEMQELDERLVKEFKAPSKDGILVAAVVEGGAAQKGGVKSGDIIVEYNGRKVEGIAELRNAIASMMPGSEVSLTLYRNGEEKKLTLKLAERPSTTASLRAQPGEPAAKQPDVLDGVTVGDLKPESRRLYNIPDNVEGALVTQVDPNSPSSEAEIKPGDVIVEIDGKSVKNADEAVKVSEEVKHKNSVRLRVNSRGATRFVVVEEPKDR